MAQKRGPAGISDEKGKEKTGKVWGEDSLKAYLETGRGKKLETLER